MGIYGDWLNRVKGEISAEIYAVPRKAKVPVEELRQESPQKSNSLAISTTRHLIIHL